MLYNLWDTLLYKPLVNILAFLVSVIPGGDVGLAVVILTILVKVLLFPLSQASIESQAKINKLSPEIAKIKKSGKTKEEQAKMTFDLYKQNKTNPFSGCLLVLIQIPIIFALYYAFLKGMNFDPARLYSFVTPPNNINMLFLGILDIGGKSLVLALCAGITQYFQASLMPKPQIDTTEVGTFQDSFTKSMQMQMKYVFPFLIAFIAYSVSGAVALYWVVNNLFSIAQQLYSNNKNKKDLSIVTN